MNENPIKRVIHNVSAACKCRSLKCTDIQVNELNTAPKIIVMFLIILVYPAFSSTDRNIHA